MITIVIPLYNKAPFISRTLDSVAAQTYTDYEVVVVDDGSTDGSPEIVANHQLSTVDCQLSTNGLDCFVPRNDAKRSQQPTADPQLSTINYQLSTDSKLSTLNSKLKLITQANAGVSAARNRGIAEAQGEYIAFLDADDEWKPDYLATQMSLVKKYPQCDVFAINYEFRDEKGIVNPTIIRKLPFEGKDGELTNYFEIASCSHPPICSISIMVRKSAIESVGGFPVGIKSGEDLLTWARLAARYKIAFSKEVKAVFISTPSDNIKLDKAQQRSGGEEYILQELLKLYNECSDSKVKPHIKAYVLRWYKIYAVLLIQTGRNQKALSLAKRALSFGGNVRLFLPLMCFGLLPPKTAGFVFKKIKGL